MNFSKSKYVSFWQCPKIIWLDKYKPSEKRIDDGAVKRMATGSMAGDLARSESIRSLPKRTKTENSTLKK